MPAEMSLRLSFGFRSETYNQRESVCGQLTIILELLGIFWYIDIDRISPMGVSNSIFFARG